MSAATKVLKPTRKVSLHMNVSGSWKDLGTFDLDQCDIDAVLDAGEALVINQCIGKGGKLKVCDAMDPSKPVLMYWSQADSWVEARHA
jgi:hypothetical protein